MMFEFFLESKERQECVRFTDRVNELIKEAKIENGLCNVYVHHTTAALSIIESADPNIFSDFFKSLNHAFPRHNDYLHDQIDNNAQSHILATQIGFSLAIPIKNGALDMGTWQELVMLEFDGARKRRLTLNLFKNDS